MEFLIFNPFVQRLYTFHYQSWLLTAIKPVLSPRRIDNNDHNYFVSNSVEQRTVTDVKTISLKL